jgi:GntR family L-lactate dehydrogenase operon transcriptional regulator
MKASAMRKPRSATRARPLPPGTSLSEEPAYVALKELGGNQGPIGCWRVRSALQAAGIVTSEATAGRLLRGLDLQGLTRAIGSRGRVLTSKGRRHLAVLERSRRLRSYHRGLLQAVRAESVEDVVDLLTARRAVETETARLAALRATKQEVQEIEQAVYRHIEETHRRGTASEQNRVVHSLIARASRSGILQAIVNVLLQEEYLQEINAYIQHATGKIIPEDHLVILRAIKDRQSKRAAEAMQAHLDRLLRAAQSYPARPKAASRRRVMEAHTRSP